MAGTAGFHVQRNEEPVRTGDSISIPEQVGPWDTVKSSSSVGFLELSLNSRSSCLLAKWFGETYLIFLCLSFSNYKMGMMVYPREN